MRKLTVVVTCSNRKRLDAAPSLQARALEPGDAKVRARAWSARLRAAGGPTLSLADLYQGESWSLTGSLLRSAGRAGFSPRLLVASAGLGLRAVSSSAPGYAATFTPGHPDGVGSGPVEWRAWWRALRSAPSALDPDGELRGAVLLVVSDNYARALHDDLVSLAERANDALVVGGSVDLPGLARLQADRGLRSQLGGSASGLNIRTAIAWLDRLPRPVLSDPEARQAWRRWAREVRRDERWDRAPLADDEVVEYARQVLQRASGASATQALRELRSSGRACEQRRFAELFARAQRGLNRDHQKVRS